MKIEIHEDKCVAAGACVMEAFDVFDQRDEDGVVVVTDTTPGPRSSTRSAEPQQLARLALSNCTTDFFDDPKEVVL